MSTTITRPLLRDLRTEMQDALAAVAKKHGVAISVGNPTWLGRTFTRGGEQRGLRAIVTVIGLKPSKRTK